MKISWIIDMSYYTWSYSDDPAVFLETHIFYTDHVKKFVDWIVVSSILICMCKAAVLTCKKYKLPTYRMKTNTEFNKASTSAQNPKGIRVVFSMSLSLCNLWNCGSLNLDLLSCKSDFNLDDNRISHLYFR